MLSPLLQHDAICLMLPALLLLFLASNIFFNFKLFGFFYFACQDFLHESKTMLQDWVEPFNPNPQKGTHVHETEMQ